MRAPNNDEFLGFVLDQMAALGSLRARRMFGGAGIYCGETFFAIVSGDMLYFKVDKHNRPAYSAAGMAPFAPFPNRPTMLNHFTVPSDVIEDAARLVAWARDSISVARNVVNKPRKRLRCSIQTP